MTGIGPAHPWGIGYQVNLTRERAMRLFWTPLSAVSLLLPVAFTHPGATAAALACGVATFQLVRTVQTRRAT